MSASLKLKKLYWRLTADYVAKKQPINKDLTYFAVTGTDGKTTTSSFLYEIAKANGYSPLLLTTVSAIFEDKVIDTHLKTNSFFSYSLKNVLSGIKSFNFIKVGKNLFLQDRKGFAENKEQHRTTPLGSEIRRLINEYEAKGANFFILETTSHAIDQYRVHKIEFDCAIYTNITNEHLDYHGTWENYANTKAKLIDQLKPNGIVVINKDDEKSYAHLLKKAQSKNNINIYSYEFNNFNKIKLPSFWVSTEELGKNTNVIGHPTNITKNLTETRVNIFGDYNAYNALAAISGFYGYKKISSDSINLKSIASPVGNLREVSGRMNIVNEDPYIIVDFAHTPNAMENALHSARRLVKPNGKLWVIFGCTGLRDQYKRPVMGKLAYDLADNIMITADDIRTESLHEVNNQIISGFKDLDEAFTIHTYFSELQYDRSINKFIVRFDEPNPNCRRDAIKFAVTNATKEDVVILLGKGHENSILFGTTDYEWSDKEEVKKALSML